MTNVDLGYTQSEHLQVLKFRLLPLNFKAYLLKNTSANYFSKHKKAHALVPPDGQDSPEYDQHQQTLSLQQDNVLHHFSA